MRQRALLLAAFVGLLAQTGCFMGSRTAGGLANLAVATAVVAANVAILASHDAHYHAYGCGHYHHWRDGRVVYYYGGHWEYYDDSSGGWYYYAD